MRKSKLLIVASVIGSLAAMSPNVARAAGPAETPTPAAAAVVTPVEKVLEECQSHPAVTHGGTPLEVCMDAYGYVKQGDKWVKKPEHR